MQPATETSTMKTQPQPVSVAVQRVVTPMQIYNLISCACEQGSGYWAMALDHHLPAEADLSFRDGDKADPLDAAFNRHDDGTARWPYYCAPLFAGGHYTFVDREEYEGASYDAEDADTPAEASEILGKVDRHKLTPESIARGLQVMAREYPWHFNHVGTSEEDAETADVFLQCCLFGEIVYG